MQHITSFFCFMLLALALSSMIVTANKTQCWKYGPVIKFPFSFKSSHPENPGYILVSCGENKETIIELLPVQAKFAILDINYTTHTIQVYNLDKCLLSIMLLKIHNLSISFSPFLYPRNAPSPYAGTAYDGSGTSDITLFNCSTGERGLATRRAGLLQCVEQGPDYQIYWASSYYSFAVYPFLFCTKLRTFSSVPNYITGTDLFLGWNEPNCGQCEEQGGICGLKNNSNSSTEIECFLKRKRDPKQTSVAIGASLSSFLLVLLLGATYHVYNSNRKDKQGQLKIERFLEDYKALKPCRFSYADIRRITEQFKDKLGQGAFGTVYKGKLSSECFVAVKVLADSKGDGEEFVNEVGTMGHIHHVNVVRLVGFCADGFRRAVVYDFLPNGSLQDFISSADNDNSFLGWAKLQDIALGIAKGVEYLHQGCDQRILHFDIKPQNVLLDHNFIAKISDFGLAKLCSKDQSIVSMTTARGTMGYIAPEVFSRNFGNVSYKSDVYSFGMVLLEMVGGRKNISSTTENTTEVYYPEWIYNLLEEGEDLRIHVQDEADNIIASRLGIVGLWCIQWHPVDRPSMQRVVRMLEEGETLTMPPNPFAGQGQTGTRTSNPTRRLNLQLEPIVELE